MPCAGCIAIRQEALAALRTGDAVALAKALTKGTKKLAETVPPAIVKAGRF